MRREEGSPVCGLGLTNRDVILSNLLVAAPRTLTTTTAD